MITATPPLSNQSGSNSHLRVLKENPIKSLARRLSTAAVRARVLVLNPLPNRSYCQCGIGAFLGRFSSNPLLGPSYHAIIITKGAVAMAGSPAGRRSVQWSSPSRSRLSEFLSENRHTELSHQDALAAAQAEHERVREAAIRVFREHELQEQQQRLLAQEERVRLQQKREEERLRVEERVRAEEEHLRALRAKTVPKLPPEPKEPPRAPTTLEPKTNGAAAAALSSVSQPQQPSPATNGARVGDPRSPGQGSPAAPANGASSAPPLSNPFGAQQPQQAPKQSPFTATPFPQSAAPAVASKPGAGQQNGLPAPAAPGPAIPASVDRYVIIHRNLKKLRASLTEQAKQSPPLKARLGDMRRDMRKNMGQLVGEKGGNKKQIANIQALLNDSLSGSIPCALIDPSDYITSTPEPLEGARHNGPQLPSLFLYLLNHFAKAVINQFVNECSTQPRNADPIGVIAALIFSNAAYLWRGKTLIDILMAKFRVTCPVLFGYRGSEKTEQGRLRLGWKRDGGEWTPEQQHLDRMKGLAAGYAAVALRDFSRSPNTNPWPPSRYWTSMARIVNTPPDEISNTQCVVLRSMIDAYEERFLQFYGSAGIAALRKALVDFPGRAPVKTPGVSGLEVLASMLKRDMGLQL
ncbi:GLE1-like protein-domain-containing protein [Xylariaceae sp. FL0804]|nr:GLE1-like protein-domain-containing protein [Xylariaceae sp. FL0804]